MEKYSQPRPVLHFAGIPFPLRRLVHPSSPKKGLPTLLGLLEPSAADPVPSDNRSRFSHSSGGQKYKIKVWAKPCSF